RSELQDLVSEVRVSSRLTDSPACLVIPEGGLSPTVERLLRASGRETPRQKRLLELNPEHPVIRNLEALRAADPSSPRLRDATRVLYEQALLAEGSPLEDPAGFAARLSTLLAEATRPAGA
ncbi:MAG: molecular chaperone HtpG, partial [Deltaproteobacteria bacterium]|nr:molecular chaperone HtpG [Deltaproteobacteria bacterium]